MKSMWFIGPIALASLLLVSPADAGKPGKGKPKVGAVKAKMKLRKIGKKLDLKEKKRKKLDQVAPAKAKVKGADGPGKGPPPHAKKKRAGARARARALLKGRKVNKMMAQEFRRHARRMARLSRIGGIATTKKNGDAIAKVEKLRLKETQRHEKRLAKLTAAPNPPKGGAQ